MTIELLVERYSTPRKQRDMSRWAFGLTQVLDVLVSKEAEGTVRRFGSGLCTSSLRLVDNDSISQSGGGK